LQSMGSPRPIVAKQVMHSSGSGVVDLYDRGRIPFIITSSRSVGTVHASFIRAILLLSSISALSGCIHKCDIVQRIKVLFKGKRNGFGVGQGLWNFNRWGGSSAKSGGQGLFVISERIFSSRFASFRMRWAYLPPCELGSRTLASLRVNPATAVRGFRISWAMAWSVN